MRVPDEVRDCVAFVGLPYTTPDGEQGVRFGGTAFLVSRPSKFNDVVVYAYLVTARHVAIHLQDRDFVIAVNNKAGTGGYHIKVAAYQAKWLYHPTDETIDVAVLPWYQHNPDYGVRAISVNTLLTDEMVKSERIGTGDEVFMTGLFVHLRDTEKNLPIVRTGTVALMTDEPIQTAMGRTEAYLIEARSIGGLSGSPAFVHPWQGNRFYLMGLMHGHWDIPIEYRDIPIFQDETENGGVVNMGLAIVVPAKKILEVLDHSELVASRGEQVDGVEPGS